MFAVILGVVLLVFGLFVHTQSSGTGMLASIMAGSGGVILLIKIFA
jgi:hypothetical protein